MSAGPDIENIDCKNTKDNAVAESPERLLRHRFCLAEFWTAWCPCSLLVKRKTEKLALIYHGRIGVSRVDAESDASIADSLQVEYIPATLFLHDGKVVARWYGDTPVQVISGVVDAYMRDN
jgi:thioredoxin-like negative regulator of GroEL